MNGFSEARRRIAKAAATGTAELTLSGLALTELPPELWSLTALTSLDLSGNQLRALPPEVDNLSALKTLNISANQLRALPPEVGNLSALTALNLAGNQLSAPRLTRSEDNRVGPTTGVQHPLPAELGRLTALISLNLSHNQLRTLPPQLGELTALTHLDLSNNELIALPPELGMLISLTSLDLSGTQLSALPSVVGRLTSLTTLNLRDNPLSKLPPEIGQLTALTTLSLSWNRLSALPPEMGRLNALTSLDLSRNQLRELPSELGQLTALTTLSLSGNQLSALPPEVGKLIALETLSLSANQLSVLPPEVGKLTALTSLDLRSNKLSALPSEMGRLSALKRLFLSNNQLKVLPSELRRVRRLERLYLHDNPLLGLPEEVLGTRDLDSGENPSSPADILNYYFALREGESRALHEVKLILIGQGAVGKTSLVERLVHGRFDPWQKMTAGIAVQRWSLDVDEVPIQINVWDFGGQEIMHATHQFFLTERCIYLVVLNAREDERQNRLDYWLKLIESYGAGSPAVVVGNKKDQKPLDMNRRGVLAKYDFVKEILETSCETGDGIVELRTVVAREIGALPHIHDRLPGSWFKVKEQVEQLNRPYLTAEEYRTACRTSGVTDRGHQETLARLLNQLGVLLNFRDDPRLVGTHFLKPRWVTSGVYAILNAPALLEARGVLDWNMMGQVLDDERYPPDRKRELIGMMEKFELCFPFEEGNGSRWLVADLLPKESQAGDGWEQSLAFEFHYPVLPNSVISRFIVRTHHLAKDRQWWRTGVVLAKDGNEALVQADLDDARIRVWIRGSVSGRRALLAVVRERLGVINASIKGLEVEELVSVPQRPKVLVPYAHLLKLDSRGETNYWPPGLDDQIQISLLLDGVESSEERDQRLRRYREGWVTTVYADKVVLGDDVGGDKTTNQTQVAGHNNEVRTESAAASTPHPSTPAPRDPWPAGSFFLIAFLVAFLVIAGVLALSGTNHFWRSMPLVFFVAPPAAMGVVGALLAVGIVGALQLRQDDRLAEEPFVRLMIASYKRLPLLRGGREDPEDKGGPPATT